MPEYDAAISYRDIPNYPGYKVGSNGAVWSCWKQRHRSGEEGKGLIGYMTSEWKELRLGHSKGYLIATTSQSGKMRSVSVHRIVLMSFVGPCPPGMESCHFPDKNRKNNNLENLRWDTKAANTLDRAAHGVSYVGEQNPAARLTEELVRTIRKEYSNGGTSCAKLATKYGYGKTTIKGVVNRKRWPQVDG